jgi:hypothetical protein
MGGARMVEEVENLELGDGLPEGKLQEPFYGVRMSEGESDRMVLDPQDGCPRYPYIEFRARVYTKEKVLSTEGP